MTQEPEERFHPTSGRFSGVVGIVIGAFLAGSAVLDGGPDTVWWLIPSGALAALLSWVMLLRPRVSLTAHDLVLRQPFSTQTVPLATIDSVGVGRVLECRAGGQRYVSAAVGRSPRQVRRDSEQPTHAVAERSYGDFVEQRIGAYVAAAHRPGEDRGPVRRAWAWPEIGATTLSILALGVLVLL